MPRSVGKRLVDGLSRTANIIILTIVVVASLITFDWLLLAVGGALELIYLLAYLYWREKSPLTTEPTSVPDSESGVESPDPGPRKRLALYLLAPPDRRRVTFLDGVLVVVTVIGFVVIGFFGFGKHFLSHPFPYLTHAEGWDIGAVIWTGFFLLYYTWKFPFTNVRVVDKAIISILGWGSLPLIYLAAYTIKLKEPTLHVFFVWLIGIVFFCIDFLIWKRHPIREEQELSRTSLIWADTPMVIAFAVLLLYMLYHRDTEHEVFVAGIVSCQLLISNAVFIVTEFGLLHSPHSDQSTTVRRRHPTKPRKSAKRNVEADKSPG